MNIIKKSYNKYISLGEETKAALWYTVCNILIKGLSLITVPVFTRVLSEEEYGLVSVFNGWKEIFLIFGTLNMFYAMYNSALIKFKKDINEFTSSIIFLIDFISTIYILIYLYNIKFWNNLLEIDTTSMVIIFLILFTLPAYNFWMAQKRFQFKYKKVVLITMLASFLSPLLSMILIMVMENDANAKIIGTEIPIIFIGSVLVLYFFKLSHTCFNKKYWIFGLKFTIPLIPHYLSGTILNQSDRIMISRLISNSKAAIYSVAYSAAFTINIVTTSINNALIPWMYKRLEDREFKEINDKTFKILIFLSLVLLIFIMVIPEIIFLLAPISYREAISILPVLVMSVFFQFLYGLFGTVEFYYEKTVYATIASVIAALCNIILNLIFIPMCNYYAAAYTTLICYILMSISHYIFMKKVLTYQNIRIKIFDTKKIFIISISFSVLGFAISYLYSYIFIRYLILLFTFICLYYKRNKIFDTLK